MKRRPATKPPVATTRFIYAGAGHIGHINRRGEHWAATARGGQQLGLFGTAPEAVRAVLAQHARNASKSSIRRT